MKYNLVSTVMEAPDMASFPGSRRISQPLVTGCLHWSSSTLEEAELYSHWKRHCEYRLPSLPTLFLPDYHPSTHECLVTIIILNIALDLIL
jgi:hypothetical protein